MAKVGDLDRLVENLVNRGLVAPKFVGRQVGQATIDELSNLEDNVRQSQATQQNQQQQRLTDISKQVSQNAVRATSGASGGSGGPAKDSSKPFALGRTKGGIASPSTTAIAIPGSKGFSIRSFADILNSKDKEFINLALQNTSSSLPELDTVFMGGDPVKSLMDVRNRLLTASADPAAVSGFFG